jgi:hypothetical protein
MLQIVIACTRNGQFVTTGIETDVDSFIALPEALSYRQLRLAWPSFLTLPLSEKIPWPYNRPFPFHRLMLCRTQCNFPFSAGVVVINSDGVCNLKVAVDCAIEAGCVAGMAKLRRWGFADWANDGHRR